MDRLTQPAIDQALRETAGWQQQGDAITRTFELPGFPDAMLFAAAVGRLAQRADHHPDILIQYRKVTLTLSTHSAGGLTNNDFELAQAVNGLA